MYNRSNRSNISNISNISVMKKEHPGPPPMKWKGQHIFPFGLCVKEMKSRFSSRPPSLPPVRNLTEFQRKTGSYEQFLQQIGQQI